MTTVPALAASEVEVLGCLIDATRALLWIRTAADAQRLTGNLVTRLGGELVPANVDDPEALSIDISFGSGDPLHAVAAPGSAVRAQLERHLPGFLDDAHRAAALAQEAKSLADEVAIDLLTGVANRKTIGRALGRVGPDDIVVAIDLDQLGAVNDRLGVDEGDRVLRAFGRVLRSEMRERDRVGRYDGGEFILLLASPTDTTGLLGRIRSAWLACRPYPVDFSAGIALARPGSRTALAAADQALRRAKLTGGGAWKHAEPSEY